MSRRRPGKALVFIIDEVGQHVARSGDKIEDLRATVEEFGKIGRNLLKARKIKAPCWIVVTSQEKLDEVVAAIDSKRVDIAKLQDRFRYRVDLAPSDIREVATKRVLAKHEDAIPLLTQTVYGESGNLNAALRLERTTRRTEIDEDGFIQFYPYPPHTSIYASASCQVSGSSPERPDIRDRLKISLTTPNGQRRECSRKIWVLQTTGGKHADLQRCAMTLFLAILIGSFISPTL